jgi:hypothetical protein
MFVCCHICVLFAAKCAANLFAGRTPSWAVQGECFLGRLSRPFNKGALVTPMGPELALHLRVLIVETASA